MTGAPAPLRVAFVGGFAACFVEPVRARLTTACELVLADERDIVARLPEVDVLVGMTFTPAMGAAATRLRLVQVPGAGTDRIDSAALPAGASLANAYGHEAGIAEYVLGAMLSLNRGLRPARREPSPGPLGGGLVARRPAAADRARAGRQDARHPRLWPHRAGSGAPRPRLRHGDPRHPA